MKKLMIAAAIVCVAVTSQAVSVKWSSDTICGVDLTKVNGNGVYDAIGSELKSDSANLAYSVTFSKGGVEADTLSGNAWATSGSKISKSANPAGIEKSTTYDWDASITVVQKSLQSLVSDEWDYSNATLSWTASGSGWTTNPTGQTIFEATPTAWTVSGAIKKEQPDPPDPPVVPEPTSAMLLLLGVAGLALRRRA